MIFAWEELKDIARDNLDAARQRLLDILSNYQGYKKCRLVVVFDGYKQKGSGGSKSDYHNIHVVYTKQDETGDMYIEKLLHDIGRNYAVRVATSDGLIQLSALRAGVLRISAQELWREVCRHYDRNTLTLPRRLYGNTNRRFVLLPCYSFSAA